MAFNIICMAANIRHFDADCNSRDQTYLAASDPTPYEYNGGQVYRAAVRAVPDAAKSAAKYCISVDWMECTTTGKFLPDDQESPPGNP